MLGLGLGDTGVLGGQHQGIWHKGEGEKANPWGTPSTGGARACAVAWGLTGSVCLSAPTDGVPTTCCFSYQHRPVPRSLISSVYTTSSSCTQPGVM